MPASIRSACVTAVAAFVGPKRRAGHRRLPTGRHSCSTASHFQETALINSGRIKFQTKDPTDTYEVTLTWQANGTSGRH